MRVVWVLLGGSLLLFWMAYLLFLVLFALDGPERIARSGDAVFVTEGQRGDVIRFVV